MVLENDELTMTGWLCSSYSYRGIEHRTDLQIVTYNNRHDNDRRFHSRAGDEPSSAQQSLSSPPVCVHDSLSISVQQELEA